MPRQHNTGRGGRGWKRRGATGVGKVTYSPNCPRGKKNGRNTFVLRAFSVPEVSTCTDFLFVYCCMIREVQQLNGLISRQLPSVFSAVCAFGMM